MKPRKHLTLILFVCLCAFPSVYAQNQSDIVDRLNKALGVTLPGDYQQKVKTFVQTNTVLKDQGTADFTENFIKEEMSKDWSIEKQNQLLFIWHAIYKQITADDLYKGDGDSKIAEDFNSRTVNVRIRACGQKYQNQVVAYMNQRSAEAKQRSAEAKQRSADAQQRSALSIQSIKIFTYLGLIYGISFYQLRDVAYNDEIEAARRSFADYILDCKEFNIDYYSLLPIEVLKYYDIEPTAACLNSITCDKAIDQIYLIAIKEAITLYNLYQRDPQTVPYDDFFKPSLFEYGKKNNLDYRAILLKELGDQKKVDDLLKFYGVE